MAPRVSSLEICRFWVCVFPTIPWRKYDSQRPLFGGDFLGQILAADSLPGAFVHSRFVYVFFFRVIPDGGEKNINKIPPKIPGQSRENFVCVCVFFFAPNKNIHRFLQWVPQRGRQLYFTSPSAPDPLFRGSSAPFPTLRVATPSAASRQAPLERSRAVLKRPNRRLTEGLDEPCLKYCYPKNRFGLF